jgi:hypothetical protein
MKMKKSIMLVTALFFVTGIYAQTRFGIKTGLNLSQNSSGSIKMNGRTLGDVDAGGMLTGFHVGLYSNVGISDYFGLQIESQFSTQGDSDSEGAITVKEHFNYVNIQALLDLKPAPSFSIFVGPQIGINVYSSMTAGEESISGDDLKDYLADNYCKINTYDVSLVVGLQCLIMDHFTIGARYNIGFTPILGITDDAKDAGISISGLANRVLQFSVGWTF